MADRNEPARAPATARRGSRRLRFTDEWIGLLVLAAVALFGAAAFEAGVLSRWLHPGARLVLLLPQTGTDGLSLGADVEVIGIHAGTVRRLRLNPDGALSAVITIDAEARPFIRRDSRAVIRRRFAVAGATFVDISRGSGAPLDWDYAVLQATTEPDPIATVTATIDQIRATLIPTLENASATAAALRAVVAGIAAGRGSVGALLTSDEPLDRVRTALATLDDVLARLRPIETHADAVVGSTGRTVARLDQAAAELREASRALPAIARHTENATADLPALVTEAQVTTEALRRLIDQLRGLWLLGGGGGGRPPDPRLPPAEIRP